MVEQGAHHLQFGFDPNNTLYMSSPSGSTYSFINTKQFLATGNGEASQGWCPQIVDTNGDGKITKPWNKFGGPIDPKLDSEVRYNLYAIIPSPVDNSEIGRAHV